MVLTPRPGVCLSISSIPSRYGHEEEPLLRWTEDGQLRRVAYHGTTPQALPYIFALDSEGNFVGLKESNPNNPKHEAKPGKKAVYIADKFSGSLYHYATPYRLIFCLMGDGRTAHWSIPDSFPFVRCVLELAVLREGAGTWKARSWGMEGQFPKDALKILRVLFFRGVHFPVKEECFQCIEEGPMLATLLETQLSISLIEMMGLHEVHSRCPICKDVFISDVEILGQRCSVSSPWWCAACRVPFSAYQKRNGKLLTRAAVQASLDELSSATAGPGPPGPTESRIVSPLPSPLPPAG